MEVQLPPIPGGTVAAYLLVLCRVGPLFLLAPVFSSRLIPVRAKLIAAGAITVAIGPVALAGQTVPTDAVGLALDILKEIGVGLAFAFVIAAIGTAAQAAAAVIDLMTGFSLGAIVDPITNVQNTPVGQLYALFTAMVFITTGGDQIMVMGLARSYQLLPVDAYPSLSVFGASAAAGVGRIFVIGLMLAAPVVIALIVADAAFALVARAAPQINVFTLAVPAKILLGLGVAAASLPFVAVHLRDDLTAAVVSALNAVTGG